MRAFQLVATAISRFLPVWLVVFSLLAYFYPYLFTYVQGWTEFCLGLIFFLMGMTLSIEQMKKVLQRPTSALYGFVLKWFITVGVSLLIAFMFIRKMPEIAAGIVLAGTVPSGTSANVYSFIAGGEVALSITMATFDTVVSPVLTPSLMELTVGKIVPIDFWALFLNIVLVVFVPLFAGLCVQSVSMNIVKKVRPYTSVISQIALLIIVLAVVSKAQPTLEENVTHIPLIFLAVVFQVTVPMFLGYVVAYKLLHVKKSYAISICFHTGICNTALSATLATEHVSSLAAVPSVLNMIVNLTIGAIVAKYFERTYVHKPIFTL